MQSAMLMIRSKRTMTRVRIDENERPVGPGPSQQRTTMEAPSASIHIAMNQRRKASPKQSAPMRPGRTMNNNNRRSSATTCSWLGKQSVGLVLMLVLIILCSVRLSETSNLVRHLTEELSPVQPNDAPASGFYSHAALHQSPQVIILPGPHKTGSSSVQACMVEWAYKTKSLQEWIWPIPSTQDLRASGMRYLIPQKQFAPWLSLLRHDPVFSAVQTPNKTKVRNVYADYMNRAWRDGRKLAYGAEAMDYIVNEELGHGDEIMEGVLDILPWNDTQRILRKSDIKVVLTYRAPRVDHAIALWHETGSGSSTSTFLRGVGSKKLFMTNTLALALKFLEQGLPTTIIDLGGVGDHGLGLCEVIACDIMEVPCQNHSIIPTPPEYGNKFRNSKQIPGFDLTKLQMSSIESVMHEYDCGLRQSLMKYGDQLTILYKNKLFETCTDDHELKPFSWLKDSMLAILAPKNPASLLQQHALANERAEQRLRANAAGRSQQQKKKKSIKYIRSQQLAAT